MERMFLAIIAVTSLLTLSTARATEVVTNYYGPKTFSSPTNGKVSTTVALPVLTTNTNGQLYIKNGDGKDLSEVTCPKPAVQNLICRFENALKAALLPILRPKIVQIYLNNVIVLQKPAWNPATGSFQVPVNLLKKNDLKVVMEGFPGTSISIQIGTKSEPVNLPPTSVIKLSASQGYEPLMVTADAFGSTDIDGTIVSYDWDFGDGFKASGSLVTHLYTVGGNYTITLKTTDDKGAVGTGSVLVEVIPDIPPVGKIILSKNSGIAPLTLSLDARSSSDPDGSIVAYHWSFGDGSSADGSLVNHEFAVGSYVVELTVTDNLGKSTKTTATVVATEPILPPNPANVAPALAATENSLPADAVRFLYTGDNPIQTGVAEGAIDGRLVSVVRGKVLNEDGSPISGVTVRVLEDQSFGQTLTREDGQFDLAMNGGGSVVISFVRNGYYTVQRRVSSTQLAFAVLDDVYMLRPDPKVTLVQMSSTVAQIAQGSISSDSSGDRTGTVLIPSQTLASLKMPDGSLKQVPQLNIRVKEYTVGPNGKKRMPAELPTTSAYTYAVQLSADEVDSYGATGVQFSQPVAFYVENFLGFDTGDAMPVGFYNSDKGRWEPAKNGRVIKILNVNDGKAELDVTGGGSATASDLLALGINDEELISIGKQYRSGTSLWRIQTDHFSIADINAFQEDVAETDVPVDDPESPLDTTVPSPCIRGSIILPQTRSLGESVSIQGTDFSLNYTTDRAPARAAAMTLDIPITPNDMSNYSKFTGVDLKVVVAGKEYKQSFSAAAGQKTKFTWDGNDVYGRRLHSGQLAEVNVSYRVSANYLRADRTSSDESTFALLGAGLSITGIPSREETIFTRTYKKYLGVNDTVASQALAGWSLNVHHVYDPLTGTLYMGDGFKRDVRNVGNIIKTVVGTGATGFSGDGGLATKATVNAPGEIALDKDGSLYFRDALNFRIRKVDRNGIITTVAGNGSYSSTGDGGLATNASIANHGGIAIDNEGQRTIYFADAAFHRIRKIDPNGIVTTIAGTGVAGFSGDGGLAINAQVNGPVEIVARDGNVYFNDVYNNRLRVIRPNGTIQTVAGNGIKGFSGDGGFAVQASINQPLGLAMGPNGDLFITDSNNNRVRRVDRSGIIRTVAGGGTSYEEGAKATDAFIYWPSRVTFSKDNSMFISSPTSPVIKRVSPSGIISTWAGTTDAGAVPADDNQLAGRVKFSEPYVMAIAPDDSIYVVEEIQQKIKKITRAFSGIGVDDIVIPSSNGQEMFIFDNSGRHLRTVNSLTGATKYSFSYTSDGQLDKISDGGGNITRIVRSGGTPVQIIAPFGQITTIGVGSDGYLTSLTNQNNESYTMSYHSGGLLSSFTKPAGNTSRFSYDSLGQLVKDEDAAGGSTSLSEMKTDRGYLIESTTAEGRKTKYSLSNDSTGKQKANQQLSNGLVSQSTNDLKGTTTYSSVLRAVASVQKSDPRLGAGVQFASGISERLPSGLLRTETTSKTISVASDNIFNFQQTEYVTRNGNTFSKNFNSSSRTWTLTSPEGRIQKIVLDSQGRVVTKSTVGMNDQSFSYNGSGKLVESSRGSRRTSYDYDERGRLSTETNSLGATKSYRYDDADRLLSTTLADGSIVYTNFDKNGNLVGVTPPEKPQHIFAYNLVDVIASYLPPQAGQGAATIYRYNLDRQLSEIAKPDGLWAKYVYQDGSELVGTIETSRGTQQNTYNSQTGLLERTISVDQVVTDIAYDGDYVKSFSNQGNGKGQIEFVRNSDFRIVSSKINGMDDVTYSYDKDGLLLSVGPVTANYLGNGLLDYESVGSLKTSYTYNANGEVTSMNTSLGGQAIASYGFERNALGQIVKRTDSSISGVNNFEYSYDVRGQLRKTLRSDGSVDYLYDKNGNVVEKNDAGIVKKSTFNNQDQILTFGQNKYTYSASGNLERKESGAEITKYIYDVFGNLRSVGMPDGSSIDYVVDSNSRRVGKKLNGTFTNCWLYENENKIVAEVDCVSGELVSRYVYGPRGEIKAIKRGNAIYGVVTDHIGSIRLVVNSTNGQIVQAIDYDDFGSVVKDTNPGFQSFGFAGGLYDQHTHLVRFGARDYDPEIGRWTSKDPTLFEGGGSGQLSRMETNLYGYSFNDPINFTDVNGEFPKSIDEAGECIFGNPTGLVDSYLKNIQRNNAEIQFLQNQSSASGVCQDNAAVQKRISYLQAINKSLQGTVDQINNKCSYFYKGGL